MDVQDVEIPSSLTRHLFTFCRFDVQAFVAKYRGASENAQKVRGNSTKPLVSKANATKEPGSRKRPSTATARLSKKLK